MLPPRLPWKLGASCPGRASGLSRVQEADFPLHRVASPLSSAPSLFWARRPRARPRPRWCSAPRGAGAAAQPRGLSLQIRACSRAGSSVRPAGSRTACSLGSWLSTGFGVHYPRAWHLTTLRIVSRQSWRKRQKPEGPCDPLFPPPAFSRSRAWDPRGSEGDPHVLSPVSALSPHASAHDCRAPSHLAQKRSAFTSDSPKRT